MKKRVNDFYIIGKYQIDLITIMNSQDQSISESKSF